MADPSAADSTLSQDVLSSLVERRHPEYDNNISQWEFMQSCYRGDREWFKDNIHTYRKEGSASYKKRKERAYRFNHTKEVVDLINKYLFRGKIIRNTEDSPKELQAFWKNANGRNTHIDNFMMNGSTESSISGRVWVVVDTNKRQGEAVTKKELNEGKYGTYAYFVQPQDVLDMSYDERGNLNWILIRETKRDDSNPFDSTGDPYHQYRLWNREEWLLMEDDVDDKKSRTFKPTRKGVKKGGAVKVVGAGKHGLGMVPVTWLDHMESDNLYSTTSLINDISYLDRAIANYLSNLDVIINNQTFSQLIIPAQGLTPGQAESDKQIKELIKFGTEEIFVYDGEHPHNKPEYISPDPGQVEVILAVIEKTINEIYHMVGVAGERTKQDNAVGIDNSSGVAKAYDFERVNSMLVNKAGALDQCERRMSRIVMAYHGQDVVDSEDWIKYPEDFDIRGLSDEFDIAANLQIVEAPDKVRKEQMYALIDKLFPRASESIIAELKADLESWPKKLRDEEREAAMDQASVKLGADSKKQLGLKTESRQGQVTD